MIISILVYVSVFGLNDHCSLNMALTSNAHTYRLYFFNDLFFLHSFAAMCKEGLLSHYFSKPCNLCGYSNPHNPINA
jgi:hypothetical protein